MQQTLKIALLFGLPLMVLSVACSKRCPPGSALNGQTCQSLNGQTQITSGGPSSDPQQANAGSTATSTGAQTAAGAKNNNTSSAMMSAAASDGGTGSSSANAAKRANARDAGAASAAPPGSGMASSGPCAGKPGEVICEGATMTHCDDTGASSSTEVCGSEALCQLGQTAKTCATCLPGTFACDGTSLSECRDGQLVAKKECASAALCNEGAGECTDMVCSPNVTNCTASGTLQTCNEDGSAFIMPQECGMGLCDPDAQRCNKCIPGASRCEGNTALKCSSDGQDESSEACSPSGECSTASCNRTSGTCIDTNKPRGTSCGGGKKCDDRGGCTLDCLKDSECRPMGECNTAVCSSAGSCEYDTKQRGEPCANNTKVCDGSGGCTLQCIEDGDCHDADQMCDTTTNRCVAKKIVCGSKPDHNCNPDDAWFQTAPRGVCVDCKITDSIYSIRCSTPGAQAWSGTVWTCTDTGVPTVTCNDDRPCVTAQGHGKCLPFGTGNPRQKFCAMPCSSCSGGTHCVLVPDGPVAGGPDHCGFWNFMNLPDAMIPP